jgi:hypothetical protein
MNKIHAAHFWVCMLATMGAFINCEIRSDFQMGASTLEHRHRCGANGPANSCMVRLFLEKYPMTHSPPYCAPAKQDSK